MIQDQINIKELFHDKTKVDSEIHKHNKSKNKQDGNQQLQSSDKDLEAKLKKERQYIIRVNHPYKIKWDLIVMLLAVYNTILIPIEVSFDPKFLESNLFFYCDSVIDFLFFIDILINF